jgi:glutathione S-transferase
MKLYYAPGACSLGIHLLLEEIGGPYELVRLNLAEGEQRKPEFAAVNRKGKVPTLVRDDGTVLTEFPAIAWWLGATNPQLHLIPADADGQARMLEAMDYIVGTVHGAGFLRIFKPVAMTPNEADHDTVRAQGREMFEKGLRLMDEALAGKEYLLGQFSLADAALFYVEFWAGRVGIDLPPNCAAHFARMKARPAVRRALEQEGLPV